MVFMGSRGIMIGTDSSCEGHTKDTPSTKNKEIINAFNEQIKDAAFKEFERIKMSDSVNKPDHYTYGKLECIDVIKEITNGNDAIGIEAFCLGNVLKYLWRYKHKNGTEDLRKARWYLNRLIEEDETNESEKD